MYLTFILVVFVITGAFYDLFYRKIPNWLTFGTFFLILLFNIFFIRSFDSVINCFLGFTVGLALLIIPYFFGGMGAGDVKFLGAIGSLVGVNDILLVFFSSTFCGLIIGVIWLIFHPARLKFLLVTGQILPATDNKQKIPYGVAISAGTLLYIGLDYIGFFSKILPWA